MQMSPDLAAAFNDQIVMELESSLAYLQMAGYFEDRSLTGMATWMRLQSDEERAHALLFFEHVCDRGRPIALSGIPGPKTGFESPADVFRTALEQERKVSAAIAELHRKAGDEGDASSLPFLQRFLEEQIEEESTVSEILDRLELIGDHGPSLLLLDRELGERHAGD